MHADSKQSIKLIEKLKNEKFFVLTWTVNDKKFMKKLIKSKVDGIITDYPKKLAKILERTMNKNNLVSRCKGIYFGEGPRWHENKLWFSDMHGDKVFTLDENDNLETVCEIKNQPSGLGWLPNGDLLIVSMLDRKILKLSNGDLSVHADLSGEVKYQCNDMVVSKDGIAYVGNFGMADARDKIKKYSSDDCLSRWIV